MLAMGVLAMASCDKDDKTTSSDNNKTPNEVKLSPMSQNLEKSILNIHHIRQYYKKISVERTAEADRLKTLTIKSNYKGKFTREYQYTFSYDDKGKLSEAKYVVPNQAKESGTYTYTLTSDGYITKSTFTGTNLTEEYTLDNNNKIAKRVVVAWKDTTHYEYNAKGILSKSINGGRARLYTFNDKGLFTQRATEKDGKTTPDITYSYDAQERLTKLSYPSRITYHYEYQADKLIRKGYSASRSNQLTTIMEYTTGLLITSRGIAILKEEGGTYTINYVDKTNYKNGVIYRKSILTGTADKLVEQGYMAITLKEKTASKTTVEGKIYDASNTLLYIITEVTESGRVNPTTTDASGKTASRSSDSRPWVKNLHMPSASDFD